MEVFYSYPGLEFVHIVGAGAIARAIFDVVIR